MESTQAPLTKRPSVPRNKKLTGPLFDPKEPLIPRLAEAAAPKKEQPIAGWYGIQRLQEPKVDVPPECMLYEDWFLKDRLPQIPEWREFPEKVPNDAWKPPQGADYHNFQPQWKVPEDEEDDKSEYQDLEQVKELAQDQQKISEKEKAASKGKSKEKDAKRSSFSAIKQTLLKR